MDTKKLQIRKESLRRLEDAAAATVAGGIIELTEKCSGITTAHTSPCATTHTWD